MTKRPPNFSELNRAHRRRYKLLNSILGAVGLFGFLLTATLLMGDGCAPSRADFSKFVGEKVQLRNPVVLVHGASMGGAWLRIGPLHYGHYWKFVPEFLEFNGNRVGVAHLTTNSSIAERAIVLKNFIEQKFPGEKVNIVAHSLGGLDARFLVSVLKSKQVLSITGIATPHHGSPLADWAYDQMERKGFWYWFLRLFGYDLRERRFLPELRQSYMDGNFNPKVPDVPGVKYYSVMTWGTRWTWSLSPLLYIPQWYTAGFQGREGDTRNDGLVTFRSQAWGEIIVEAELDHLGQINHHIFRPWAGDSSLAMYHRVLQRLAKDGL